MPRFYRLALAIPAILVALNALSMFVAAGPCIPGEIGCP